MQDKDISKYLSLVLRHQPEVLGISLSPEGWADVPDLLAKMTTKKMPVTLERLKQVVRDNDKQRFAFNEDYSKIRASQGHSVHVDLGLTPLAPPLCLYHGTAEKNVAAILQEGIRKGNRQHVHLSVDQPTAVKVGQRHGKPVVLLVKSGEMHTAGKLFYLSANQVWLTDFVPPEFVELLSM